MKSVEDPESSKGKSTFHQSGCVYSVLDQLISPFLLIISNKEIISIENLVALSKHVINFNNRGKYLNS